MTRIRLELCWPLYHLGMCDGGCLPSGYAGVRRVMSHDFDH